MRLKKIYAVTYHGLGDEVSLVKAFDREEDAKTAVEIYGHCEIYSHEYVEIFLQEEN